jgi:transcriptional regulator of NAD metabolism
MYRMTYNQTGVTGCSARGIAKRESKEELLKLAEELKETISNIEIHPVEGTIEKRLPMEIFINMKELR